MTFNAIVLECSKLGSNVHCFAQKRIFSSLGRIRCSQTIARLRSRKNTLTGVVPLFKTIFPEKNLTFHFIAIFRTNTSTQFIYFAPRLLQSLRLRLYGTHSRRMLISAKPAHNLKRYNCILALPVRAVDKPVAIQFWMKTKAKTVFLLFTFSFITKSLILAMSGKMHPNKHSLGSTIFWNTNFYLFSLVSARSLLIEPRIPNFWGQSFANIIKVQVTLGCLLVTFSRWN